MDHQINEYYKSGVTLREKNYLKSVWAKSMILKSLDISKEELQVSVA